MVKTIATLNGEDNPIPASAWSGTETINLRFGRDENAVSDLLRYINGLDVAVDVTVNATDTSDEAFSESEALRSSALTVSAGGVDSDLVTEPWELLEVQVTPASNPSSGEFELRSIKED